MFVSLFLFKPDFYVNINSWKDNNTIYMSVSFDCSSLNIPLSKENKWRCAHDSNMSGMLSSLLFQLKLSISTRYLTCLVRECIAVVN